MQKQQVLVLSAQRWSFKDKDDSSKLVVGVTLQVSPLGEDNDADEDLGSAPFKAKFPLERWSELAGKLPGVFNVKQASQTRGGVRKTVYSDFEYVGAVGVGKPVRSGPGEPAAV